MLKYKFLEKVAIADIAFEAYGKSLNELFESCALAIFNITADTKTIKEKVSKEIVLKNKTLEGVLYDFLTEIIFIKDAESLIFCKADVKVTHNKNGFTLNAILKGDKINPARQKLGNDIKAITMHMFSIKKIKKGYIATVVVDI